MRVSILCLALLPCDAGAETLSLTAPPVAVTVYASGALVTRSIAFDIPAGQHELRIADMDPGLDAAMIEVALTGAVLSTRGWDQDGTGPYRAPRTPQWRAAKASLDQARSALWERDDAIALVLARAEAAQDQITFLNAITLPDQTITDVNTVRAIGQLIASDGTAARAAIRAAETEARLLQQDRDDLVFAVESAAAALNAVTPPDIDPATLTLAVLAAQSGPATLTLRYPTERVTWAAVYSLHLDDDLLRVERGAQISQNSAEDWINVDLTLSTLSPFSGSEPGPLWPLLRRIQEPDARVLSPATLRSQTESSLTGEQPVEPAQVYAEQIAGADLSGIGVSYSLPDKITVRTEEDSIRVALGTIEFDAELSARAVPARDKAAFRLVHFTNSSSEILLPGQAVLYVDDQLIGNTRLDTLPPSAKSEIFFGPIEGLRLKRIVLDRNEGDRGIIARSNETRESVRLEVENLTERAWSVSLRDAVPYSEQTDLKIEWQAAPAPKVEAVDDQRGILEWRFDLEPEARQSIALETTLRWPEGMVLR